MIFSEKKQDSDLQITTNSKRLLKISFNTEM